MNRFPPTATRFALKPFTRGRFVGCALCAASIRLRQFPWILGLLLLGGCGGGPAEDEATTPTEVAVQVGQVVRATLRASVDAYGTVEGEPAGGGRAAGAVKLSSPAAGLVLAVPVSEGERVAAGQVIVQLDDRAARAQLRLAEQQMERVNQLHASGNAAEKAVQEAAQQLAAARAQLALVQLSSPMTGVVARILVQPGQAVAANTVVAEVLDPSRLVATLTVPAGEAAALQPGQPAELRAGQTGTVAAAGRVLYVSPDLDPQTATVLVRVSVPPDAGLRAGQFVHARIRTEARAGRLAVPRAAVYTDHDGQSTLSLVEGNVARQRVVKVGLREGDLVEVEGEGVSEGATVVTVGAYALPKETRIRILNANAQEAK